MEKWDMICESPVVWGIGTGDPGPSLELLGSEGQSKLVHWPWDPA